MSALDWVVFVLFVGYVVFDGVRRGRGTKDLEGYFAGGRSIPWWAAGLSVMATQASAITVIGTTGQGHDGGMDFVQTYFGLPFAMVLLCVFVVPLYRRASILTAYEYLEGRFGPATRSLAALIFLVSRCLAFGIVIYAPAVVMSAMLAVDIRIMVIVIGALTTGYTLMGGVNAVIWTDVKQMVVIFGGLLLCLGILLARLLGEFGFGDVLDLLGAAGKLNALEVTPDHQNFVPRLVGDDDAPKSFWDEKYNLWSGLIGGLFLHLAYFGCDQSQVQRILTNPTARESRMALLMSAFAKVPMQLLVLFIGVLLYLFFAVFGGPLLFNPADRAEAAERPAVAAIQERYEANAAERLSLARQIAALETAPTAELPLVQDYQRTIVTAKELRAEAFAALGRDKKIADTNYVFPYFVLANIPPILLGLIIAAIFAAAMSSADSALNSLTAATVVDFYRRWIRPQAGDAESLLASRVVTLFWGTAATVAALSLGGGGSIVEFINKVGSFFYGSLLGVFLLALVCKRAGPRAGFLGLVGGMAAVLAVYATLEIQFLWFNVVGAVGVLVVGWGVVLLGAERPRPAASTE